MNRFIFSKIASFICLCLVLSCVSNQKTTKTRKSRSHHNLAVSLIQKCQFAAALKELNQAVKLKPLDPYLYHSLGLVYFQFKKYNKATKLLQKALKLKPDFTPARVDLARSLIETNNIQSAIQHLKAAKEDLTYLQPENIHAHLGFAYYKQKQFHQAKKYFSVSRKIQPKNCAIALYYGKSLYFLNLFKKALPVFESSKTWCQNSPPSCTSPNFESYYFSALTYYKMGQLERAKNDLQIFLSKDLESNYRSQALNWMRKWKQK